MPICESTCLRRVCRCFSFEALLQVLKHIAANCNYKDVSFRMAEFISYRVGLTLLQDRLTHVHDPMFRFSSEPITIERGVDDSLTVVDAARAIDDFLQQVRYARRPHASCTRGSTSCTPSPATRARYSHALQPALSTRAVSGTGRAQVNQEAGRRRRVDSRGSHLDRPLAC